MSGLEGLAVLGCVAAVVSAFHGGAELVEIMRERKERKKKRKSDQTDVVQRTQQDMLHGVLQGSASQVDDTSLVRRQRFGRHFEEGDDVATMELMRVVMHLQGQVIDALRIARNAEEAYVLNIGRLYEFAVADRQAAIGSMDGLCQRIMQRMPPEPLLATSGYQSNAFDMRNVLYAMPGVPTMPSGGLRRRGSTDSAASYSTARTGWQLPAAIEPRTLQITDQNLPPSGPVPHRADSVISNATFKSKFAFLSGKIRKDDSDMDSILEHDPFATSSRIETLPDDYKLPNAKPTSKWLVPKDDNTFVAQGQYQRSFSNPPFHSVGSQMSDARSLSISSSNTTPSSNLTPSTSDASSRRSHSGAEKLEDMAQQRSRFDSAPEVVTEYTMPRAAYMQSQRHASLWDYSSTGRIADTIWEPPLPNTEPLDPWSPLDKPAKKNNFHSFCEGAWLTRSSVKSGLSISQKPHGLTSLVPYWQCKKCQFSCIAPYDNKKVLPPQIYTSHHGIRYRWLFLAKSHMKSSDPTSKAEAYTYGCIFCTAEGRITSAYGTLDTLMEHIATQHGRQTISPETREKTRCIIGRFATNTEAWDINILEQPQANYYDPAAVSPIYQGVGNF